MSIGLPGAHGLAVGLRPAQDRGADAHLGGPGQSACAPAMARYLAEAVPGANLHVIGLLQHASALRPELLQAQDEFLKSETRFH